MRAAISCVFLASLLAGCGLTTTYTPTNTSPRPLAGRAPESVEVFTSRPPDRPYVDVGLIEVRQRTGYSKGTPAMLTSLRERGAEIGCDAIVVGESTAIVRSNWIEPRDVETRRGYHATCIVFTGGTALTSATLHAGDWTPPPSPR